jgi:hypothetical protein
MIRTPELEMEGACCFGSTCQIASEQFCQAWGGQYFGTGVECQGVICGPTLCPGDLNCDGSVDFDDIDPFVLALSGQAAYQAQFPNCNWLNADTNNDGTVDFDDIDPFVGRIGSTCP